MHTYSTPGKSFFLSFLLVRITLVTLLFAPVWANAQVQQPDPSALRFALPAVKVNDLSVPARMITVDRLQAAKAYAGTVLVKTRSAQRPSKNATSFQSVSWNQTLAALSVSKINAMIPEGVSVNKEEHAFGIDRIFEVRFEPAVDVFEACRRIAENPDVEYVTPVYD
ncbi:MAG: hypothetical protein ACK54V_07370, partial [Candidatus Kapaibacterium sp.]